MTAQDVFRAVLKDFIPDITLAHYEEKPIRITSSHYIPPANLDPNDMISLVQQCVSLDLRLEVHRLCDKLQELAAPEVPAVIVMTRSFIPFTEKLYMMAPEQSMSPQFHGNHSKAYPFLRAPRRRPRSDRARGDISVPFGLFTQH